MLIELITVLERSNITFTRTHSPGHCLWVHGQLVLNYYYFFFYVKGWTIRRSTDGWFSLECSKYAS